MPSTLQTYAPPQTALDVLYEDEQLLVVNKPTGLLSVPGKAPEHADCLESRVKTAVPDALLVHRLDMETSGVFIMAKTKEAQRHLGLQFEHRNTQKSYVARVWGHISDDEGSIDLPLICDWPNRPKQMVDLESGKQALTHWRVMEREAGNQQVTRVALHPHTGRSHQLRVHMLEIGHPILGDRLYASGAALSAASRLQLHAETLTVMHPSTKQMITFQSPTPF